jgi:hypothetical protein
MSDTAKIIADATFRERLARIQQEFPEVIDPQVAVSTSRDALIDDLSRLIHRMPMTTEQACILKEAVDSKFVSKTCARCLKVKPEIDGIKMHIDGDLSKPKRFVCKECK